MTSLCPSTTVTRLAGGRLACTKPADHTDEHTATGVGGHILATWANPDPPVTVDLVIDVLTGQAPGCVIDEDTDGEAFAALPDCHHCGGTGKNLTGSPWEEQR